MARVSPLAEHAVGIFEKASASVTRGTWGKPYNNLPTSDSPRSIHGHVGAALNSWYKKHGQRHGLGLYCRGVLMELVGGDVTKWNDTPGRTKEEVVALLDQAAEASRLASWPSHQSSKLTSTGA